MKLESWSQILCQRSERRTCFSVLRHAFVESETLRHRLDREKQLSVDSAVGIATAVALHVQHTGAFLSGCRILGT